MDKAIAICLALAGVCIVVAFIMSFLKLPREKQLENLREWLKWAVTEAEKALGRGTGQLKLRYVYSLACNTFKWLPTLLTFNQFSMLVDDALYWMKDQINTNGALEMYVKGE